MVIFLINRLVRLVHNWQSGRFHHQRIKGSNLAIINYMKYRRDEIFFTKKEMKKDKKVRNGPFYKQTKLSL